MWSQDLPTTSADAPTIPIAEGLENVSWGFNARPRTETIQMTRASRLMWVLPGSLVEIRIGQKVAKVHVGRRDGDWFYVGEVRVPMSAITRVIDLFGDDPADDPTNPKIGTFHEGYRWSAKPRKRRRKAA